MKFMTESELFLLDTNVLVYGFEYGEGVKNTIAKELINRCWQGKNKFAVSSQNLAEFAFVSTRKSKLDLKQINEIVGYINDFYGFVKINYLSSTVLSAIAIAEEHKMSFWDSLLAATMKENGIFNIYTENTKDFKMRWINAVNPFNKD